jgi:hypothetical protein
MCLTKAHKIFYCGAGVGARRGDADHEVVYNIYIYFILKTELTTFIR